MAKDTLRKGLVDNSEMTVLEKGEVFIVNLSMVTVPWWLGSTLETGAVAGWKA